VPRPPAAASASRVPGDLVPRSIPPPVTGLLDELRRAGHAGYVVGGSLRDVLLGREPADWDLATDARPEQLTSLFRGAVYENAFGTVAVRRGDVVVEITTFRTDHEYADFRRPHRVEFGADLVADLARRDFTVNAMAWGGTPDTAARDDEGARGMGFSDPYGGLADLRARQLRAVGDPDVRFREDALRMIRAVRLAAALELAIEPSTLAAIAANASLVAHLSGERIAGELARLLAVPRPSVGLRLLAGTGLLEVISPELGAQREVPQNKIAGEDLWDHTLRTVDAVPADRPVVRLAALLHDIGKPATLADGRFHRHDVVGADQAADLLRRLRYPRVTADQVTHLVRHHMFPVDTDATDAAIRRFIKRVGREHLEALFALRRADDIGSGMDPDEPDLVAYRARVEAEVAAEVALDRAALRIDGNDLIAELGFEPGPTLGHVLDELVERVIADPALNERATLLMLAQGILADVRGDAQAR
jgi:tRNA nucleotidyltransferase (CCA-adding enzyme)